MKKTLLLLLFAATVLSVFAGGVKAEPPADQDFERWESVKPRLENLAFDDFIESAYRELTLRTPELVTELGLDEAWGLGGDRLNNMSEEYLAETERIRRGILEILKGYEENTLSDEQKSSCDVVRWQLNDLARLYEYRFDSFTVNHFTIAEPAATELFFSDVQPLGSLSEAENYLIRLEQVGTKMEQMAEGVLIRQEYGTVLPELSIRWALGNIRRISSASPSSNIYYKTFEEKIRKLGLEKKLEDELLTRASAASETSVVPGYRRLEKVLSEQRPLTDGNKGAWSLPGGREYYEAVLYHHTTADLSPEEVQRRGYSELERIHAEMMGYFSELGIDTDQSIAEMYRDLDNRAEIISGTAAVETFTEILWEAERISAQLFHMGPAADVIVKGAEIGGFYMSASLDGSRPGAFFAAESPSPLYKMHTLTFHETVPGHHFQLALANELPISPWQRGSSFLGYVEGWALYAEKLMEDSGYYDGDPAGQLGRLQAEAHRAARLVIDTGLNCFEWDFSRAVKFFVDNTGYSEGYGTWESLRYIIWPGQASSYMTGLLAILDLRDKYRQSAGAGCDIRDFHSLVLEEGAVPLSILKERVRSLK